MNTLSKTLRLFLDSIGRRSEYEFYLNKFQSDRSVCFALVLPDTESIELSGDLMTFDLQFLLRLELSPVVLLCGVDAEKNAEKLAEHGSYHVLQNLHADSDSADWRTQLQQCIKNEEVPVFLWPDESAEEAVKALMPTVARRLHILRDAGMLHDTKGEKIFYYYTRRTSGPVNPSDLDLVKKAEAWLDHDPQLHISVSSPLFLLQEMFTVRGRGSIIRPGSQISHVKDYSEVNSERLLELIETAFARKLKNPEHLKSASDFFIESRYRGAVILETHPAGKYLSKFTVGTEARGEGVAQELWEAACEIQPRLFWRSRRENPVNQWYERHASGHHNEGNWTVFWKGVDAEALPGIIRYCLDRPSDFVEK